MILRKPYAFFIKMFKPIHILLGLVIAYLIYLDNNILTFLNKYIYSTSAIKTDGISNSLISPLLYIIPLIVIIFSLLILGVMFNKKKPIRFYIVNIFSFIVVLIINIYISNFIKQIEVVTVSIRTAKLLHDITLISIMIQSVAFVFLIVRGMGVNFKKFNFDSEVLKLDISESDKEEIEIALDLDLDESKRKRNKRWRYLKYSYCIKTKNNC